MAKTLIGLFDNLSAAQATLRELAGSGIAEQDIGFMADQRHEVPSTAHLNEAEGEGADDALGIVITVAADQPGTTDRARAILERHGALAIDERDAEWKKQGWKGRFETEGYGGPERRVNNTPWLGPERRKAA
jgi:hypothetical protein